MIAATALLLSAALLPTQGGSTPPQKTAHHHEVEKSGDKAMGFSHEKTTHHFYLRANGGVIQVDANAATDATNVAAEMMTDAISTALLDSAPLRCPLPAVAARTSITRSAPASGRNVITERIGKPPISLLPRNVATELRQT